jgi:hypothetical protein
MLRALGRPGSVTTLLSVSPEQRAELDRVDERIMTLKQGEIANARQIQRQTERERKSQRLAPRL